MEIILGILKFLGCSEGVKKPHITAIGWCKVTGYGTKMQVFGWNKMCRHLHSHLQATYPGLSFFILYSSSLF